MGPEAIIKCEVDGFVIFWKWFYGMIVSVWRNKILDYNWTKNYILTYQYTSWPSTPYFAIYIISGVENHVSDRGYLSQSSEQKKFQPLFSCIAGENFKFCRKWILNLRPFLISRFFLWINLPENM